MLSPLIADLLSGSAPPLAFLFDAPALLLLYGSAAVLARELTRRWAKGWPTLLLLGAGFGLLVEGLQASGWFNPHWPDLGFLAYPGHFGAMNWAWILQMAIYQGLMAIAVPILLLSLIRGRSENRSALRSRPIRPWVRRTLWLVLALMLLAGAGGSLAGQPPSAATLLVLSLAIACLVVARQVPAAWPATPDEKAMSIEVAFGIGLAATIGFFLLVYGVPLVEPPAGQLLLTLVVLGAIIWIVAETGIHRRRWAPSVQFALLAGALMPFIAVTPLEEVRGRTGMTFVGLLALSFLAWLGRQILFDPVVRRT